MKTTALLLLWLSKANIAGDVAEAGAKSWPNISRYPSSDNSASIMFSGFSLYNIYIQNIYRYMIYSYRLQLDIRLSLEVPLYSYPNISQRSSERCRYLQLESRVTTATTQRDSKSTITQTMPNLAAARSLERRSCPIYDSCLRIIAYHIKVVAAWDPTCCLANSSALH